MQWMSAALSFDVTPHFTCAVFRRLDVNAMICSLPSLSSWSSAPPIWYLLQSELTMNGLDQSGKAKHGAVASAAFSVLNARSWSAVQFALSPECLILLVFVFWLASRAYSGVVTIGHFGWLFYFGPERAILGLECSYRRADLQLFCVVTYNSRFGSSSRFDWLFYFGPGRAILGLECSYRRADLQRFCVVTYNSRFGSGGRFDRLLYFGPGRDILGLECSYRRAGLQRFCVVTYNSRFGSSSRFVWLLYFGPGRAILRLECSYRRAGLQLFCVVTYNSRFGSGGRFGWLLYFGPGCAIFGTRVQLQTCWLAAVLCGRMLYPEQSFCQRRPFWLAVIFRS